MNELDLLTNMNILKVLLYYVTANDRKNQHLFDIYYLSRMYPEYKRTESFFLYM